MVRWRSLGVVAIACLMAGVTARAQEKTIVSTGPAASNVPEAGKDAAEPVLQKDSADKDAGDKKGKKGKKKKEKPPKLMPMAIVNGALTMDGATAKAALNYDIADLHYLYIWAPGIGTLVISNKQFPGAVEEKKGFSSNAVDVRVEDHKLEIYSDRPLFDKKTAKEMVRDVRLQTASAWVRVDKEFTLTTPYPAMGYGTTAAAPYAWPGAKPEEKRTKGVVTPPPLPEWMRPVMALPVAAGPVGSGAAGVQGKPVQAEKGGATPAAKP